MNDTLMTVGAIFLAAVLMFIFPLMSTADRTDDVSQQVVKAKTQEFVDKLLSFYVYDTLFTAGITVIGSGFCAYVLYECGYLFVAGIFFVIFILGIISTGWLLKNPIKYYLEKWTRKKV